MLTYLNTNLIMKFIFFFVLENENLENYDFDVNSGELVLLNDPQSEIAKV